MPKWIYSFGGGKADGSASNVELLGGKGANLHEMSLGGLPVPPGFTISTAYSAHFHVNGLPHPAGLKDELAAALAKIEALTGCVFGGAQRPLLLSVRSGARVSMPGMTEAVLNLGLNDQTVEALAEDSGDARFCL